MSSSASSLMATFSAYYSFDMDTFEGYQLRKSVLIRNAVKASARVGIKASESSIQSKEAAEDAQQSQQRWMLMAARSGLHPSDNIEDCNDDDDEDDDNGDEELEEEDGDDEVILLPRIENKDYYQTAIQRDDVEDEVKWFDGLLQEVRAADQGPTSPCSLDDDEDRQMSMSSTPSLPSLIMDEYDDASEEDEGDETHVLIQPRSHLKCPPSTTTLC